MNKTPWQRVSRRRPCPVCERTDWCLFTGDPGNADAVICAESSRLSGVGRRAGFTTCATKDRPGALGYGELS